jgi:hypothetical protein
MKFGNFLMVGGQPASCPSVFKIIANASEHRPAVQRTICRKPGEDDDALWSRVLATALRIDQRMKPNDPFGGTCGGLIVCDYESTQQEDWRLDALEDFKRLLFRAAERDPDEKVRSCAQHLLADMVFSQP